MRPPEQQVLVLYSHTDQQTLLQCCIVSKHVKIFFCDLFICGNDKENWGSGTRLKVLNTPQL